MRNIFKKFLCIFIGVFYFALVNKAMCVDVERCNYLTENAQTPVSSQTKYSLFDAYARLPFSVYGPLNKGETLEAIVVYNNEEFKGFCVGGEPFDKKFFNDVNYRVTLQLPQNLGIKLLYKPPDGKLFIATYIGNGDRRLKVVYTCSCIELSERQR